MRSQSILAALLAAFAALLVAAIPLSAQEAAAPACTGGQPSGDPFQIDGRGQSSSAPFVLAGGAYRVEWGMRQGGGGNGSIQLMPADADDLSRWRLIVRSPVNTGNGNAGDETYLYTVKPGPYFLKVDAPGDWFVRLTPKRCLQQAGAAPGGSTDPAALAPFVGTWGKHGYSLVIRPDGWGTATWRVYSFCNEPGAKLPCDWIDAEHFSAGGHAVFMFSSVDGRVAHGMMVDNSDPEQPVFRPVSLTLQANGTALLADDPRSSERGTILCGSPEAWQTGVCGA